MLEKNTLDIKAKFAKEYCKKMYDSLHIFFCYRKALIFTKLY